MATSNDTNGGGTEVWITGLGIVSSLGEGPEQHWTRLAGNARPEPVVDESWFPPYPIHDLVELDFSKQIPKRSDQRQMELWQRTGTYAAGLALDDAGIAKNPQLLDVTNLNVAAGSGERDTSVDKTVLEKIVEKGGSEILANEILPGALRPTLFLAQLSNLLAGNISIIHNVTGASRTYMGEEMAGMVAIEDAWKRVRAGQGNLFLIGGASNARREDLLLGFELGRHLWAKPYKPVWEREPEGGGMVIGSAGVFLVIESADHARARGAKAYARLTDVRADRCRRAPGAVSATLQRLVGELRGMPAKGPLAVLSGACGAGATLGEERDGLSALASRDLEVAARAYASLFGHTVEVHFPLGVLLAALAVSKGGFYPPFDDSGIEAPLEGAPDRVLLTGAGHWRGEAAALIERVTEPGQAR